MNAVEKINTETPIFKLGKGKQSQEARKVSIEDGFVQIPRELRVFIRKNSTYLTETQKDVIEAIIDRTIGWHKDDDWVVNELLLEDLGRELTKSNLNMISAVKNELFEMKILIKNGKRIGLNLVISEWIFPNKTGNKQIPTKLGRKSQKSLVSNPNKIGNTKETITKNKINNPPIVPQGETDLSESSEEKLKPEPVDYQGVMDAWNESFAETPIGKLRVLNDHRKRQIHRLAKNLRSQFGSYTPKAFRDYFNDFWQQISAKPNSFYLGNNNRKWVADFDYVMLPKTFAKTVEETL